MLCKLLRTLDRRLGMVEALCEGKGERGAHMLVKALCEGGGKRATVTDMRVSYLDQHSQ